MFSMKCYSVLAPDELSNSFELIVNCIDGLRQSANPLWQHQSTLVLLLQLTQRMRDRTVYRAKIFSSVSLLK